MKRLIPCLTLLCLCLWACTSDSQAGVQKITPEEAKQMMEQGEVLIVDVRSEEEYAQGHIRNAVNVPLERIGDMNHYAKRDDALLVYCRSGKRSAQASERLLQDGFSRVYDFGGLLDWPYDIVK